MFPLLLSSAIVLIPSLIISGSNRGGFGFLIGFSIGFDFYLWIIYWNSGGLFGTTDIIHEVAFFDYGFYIIPGFIIFGKFILPFMWSEKCVVHSLKMMINNINKRNLNIINNNSWFY